MNKQVLYTTEGKEKNPVTICEFFYLHDFKKNNLKKVSEYSPRLDPLIYITQLLIWSIWIQHIGFTSSSATSDKLGEAHFNIAWW